MVDEAEDWRAPIKLGDAPNGDEKCARYYLSGFAGTHRERLPFSWWHLPAR
jgi:hypothetical protein